MAASSQIGNIDQEFFPYLIDYIKLLILKLFGSSKGGPQEDIQKHRVVDLEFLFYRGDQR